MTDQPQSDLFSYVPARASDPPTARAAAESINIPRLERVVLDALAQYGPMTSHETAEATGLELVTVSPRFAPLRDKGLIEDSGEKRLGRSRRLSIVWRLA